MKTHRVVWQLILTTLATVVAVALLALLPWSNWGQNEKLAAWVQAVGSVVAILVAVAIPALQHRAETRARAGQVAEMRRTQKTLLDTLSTEACALLERLKHVINLERTFGTRQAFPDAQMLFWRNLSVKVDFAYIDAKSAEMLGTFARHLAAAESLYRRSDGGVIANQETNSLDLLIEKANSLRGTRNS